MSPSYTESPKVSAIQMVSQAPIDRNYQPNWHQAKFLAEKAVSEGAQLIVFPENFLSFGSKKRFVVSQQQEWLANLAILAKHCNCWIVAGTLPLQLSSEMGSALRFSPERKPYATCLVFNNSGEICGEYRKAHLFDASVNDRTGQYRESDDYSAGTQAVVVPTPWGPLGLAVCYDLRFPEYFRLLREQGATMVAVPSAFTYKTGQAHWKILCCARAIENQVFILASNQGGEHSVKRVTWGESMVVDPWGKVLRRMNTGEGVVSVTLDLAEMEALRERMPVWKHKKF